MLLLFEAESGARDTVRFIEEKGLLGTWRWDLATRKMQWSAGLFRIFGFAPGSVEPSYALLDTITHPDDLRSPGELDAILNRAGPIEREFRVILRTGRVRYLISHGEVLLGRDGRPARAVGVICDRTRLHEALLNLEMLRERFRKIVEAISGVVWSVNADGAVKDLSNWHEFTGQPVRHALGDGWLEAVHTDDRQCASKSWAAAISSRAPFAVEFRLQRTDGTYRWARTRAFPTFKTSGSVHEWTAVSVDIHEQKVWSPPAQPPAVTGAQLRAARGILNWSVRDLADAADVSVSTIRRLEEIDGPPRDFERGLAAIRQALERAGVEFLFPPLGKPAVRPH